MMKQIVLIAILLIPAIAQGYYVDRSKVYCVNNITGPDVVKATFTQVKPDYCRCLWVMIDYENYTDQCPIEPQELWQSGSQAVGWELRKCSSPAYTLWRECTCNSHSYSAEIPDGVHKVCAVASADPGDDSWTVKLDFQENKAGASTISNPLGKSWWYDSNNDAMCWLANETRTDFYIDFDGDHRTAIMSYGGSGWHIDYGEVAGIRACIKVGGGTYFGFGPDIGEKKIDKSVGYLQNTQESITTEWFRFFLPKPVPPTDWVVCAQPTSGDGQPPEPITNCFYSEDAGENWSECPIEGIHSIDITPEDENAPSIQKPTPTPIQTVEDWDYVETVAEEKPPLTLMEQFEQIGKEVLIIPRDLFNYLKALLE